MSILINQESGLRLSVADRGVQYADGLFETIAVQNGCPLLWEVHLHRLQDGCARMGLPLPDVEALEEALAELIESVDRGVAKIVVTAGEGGRGYARPENMSPNTILSLHPWPDYPSTRRLQGIRARWCETTTSRNASLAGMKHLARLENVMARREWTDTEIAEGLMCDDTGAVIEGTMSNLFAVLDGQLVTPDLSDSGVAGVMRDWLISSFEIDGGRVVERRLTREELESASEVFLTNSIIGCWPVVSLDGVSYPVGTAARKALSLLNLLGAELWEL